MIAQLIEIFKPHIKAKAAEAKRLLRIRELTSTLGDIRDQAAGITMDAETREMMGLDMHSIAHAKARQRKEQEIEMRLAAAVADDSQSAVERESFLIPYESTFDDFNEMAIQFGYCECTLLGPRFHAPMCISGRLLTGPFLPFVLYSGAFLASLSNGRLPRFDKQPV